MSGFERNGRIGLGRGAPPRFGLISLFAISSLLLLSSLYAAEASVFRKAREGALVAASPLLSVFSGPIAFFNQMVGNVDEYFFVLEQNQSLREQLLALRYWEQEARDLAEIVEAYERLGFLYPPPVKNSINASVVGESSDAFNHSMILNSGWDSGVERGQAVVDDLGMIGRIVDVSQDASRVLLLTDVQSNIPVFVAGSAVEGILVGRSTTSPAIEFTRDDDLFKVEPGQIVQTSGAGGVLPRGLNIGKIEDVQPSEAIVDLDANFARTRLVRVINYEFVAMNQVPDADGAEELSRAVNETPSVTDQEEPLPASEDASSAQASVSTQVLPRRTANASSRVRNVSPIGQQE
ncbi:MAG: rod shape-determining protein MreC [Pseudomonadota bacterium]